MHPLHQKANWKDTVCDVNSLAIVAPLSDKTSLIVRCGRLMLATGDAAWRVRDSMNRVGSVLGVSVHADISLTSIECTCMEGTETLTEVASNMTAHVNCERIMLLEAFIERFERDGASLTIGAIHEELDVIEKKPTNYNSWQTAVASGAACGAFIFLLGGGALEVLCAFMGAALGQFVRHIIAGKGLNQFVGVGAGVSVSCLTYFTFLSIISLFIPGAFAHEMGYIGAMLFVIPGFPLITSGFDIFQSEMRSGIERLGYALSVILCGCIFGLLIAMLTPLEPDEFLPYDLPFAALTLLRVLASFVGVFGFSVLFNSTPKMCAIAGIIGAIANTLRLTLTSLTSLPPEVAAFIGAFVAGVLATLAYRRAHVPRTSIMIPSIVIMVPGLYMYQAMYYMGVLDAPSAASCLLRAAMIVVFLPIGLITARVLTDKRFRKVS